MTLCSIICFYNFFRDLLREEGEGGPKEKDETLEELSGVQESRDLFDTSESDEMTARADNCGCNKIVCVCAQEESQSLLTDF